jgi:CBS domain-containing protein
MAQAPAAFAPARGSHAQVENGETAGDGGDMVEDEGGSSGDGPVRKLHVLEMDGNTCSSLRQLLKLGAHCSGFPVVVSHAHPVVVGFVSRTSLLALLQARHVPHAAGGGGRGVEYTVASEERGNAEVDVMSVAQVAPLQVDEDTTIDMLMDLFVGVGSRFVLVSSRAMLKGIITKKDLLHYLNQIQ